ncbi:MAG: glycosyltransferase [Chthoniobacterales bacterium]
MKILQIVQTLDPRTGGVARAVLAMSGVLADRGEEVEIVALDEPAAPWLRDLRVNVHGLGVGLTSYRYSRKLLPWLRQHAARFDCVIVNGLWQYLSFASWRAFADTPIPYFVYPHGMLDPWFKTTFPFKHLKKWLYWPWSDYRLLRDARAVIFTSDEERREARKSFWLYRCRERVATLGIEPSVQERNAARELFLNAHALLRGQRFILFLGRIHPKKGCDLLVDALAANTVNDRSLHVVIAGPDQVGWQAELQSRAERYGIHKRVCFVGMLEGAMKTGAFAAAGAFILPSHQENFGLSVVEALAAGVPVLVSNRVNIWREIVEDDAGYVESDDGIGTARLIQRWLATPEERRLSMRRNARASFERRFTADRAADALLAVLRETTPEG